MTDDLKPTADDLARDLRAELASQRDCTPDSCLCHFTLPAAARRALATEDLVRRLIQLANSDTDGTERGRADETGGRGSEPPEDEEVIPEPTPEDLARDLAADAALCDAATKGPWTAAPANIHPNGYLYGPAHPHRSQDPPGLMRAVPPAVFRFEDCEMIASAREGWPAALRLAEHFRTRALAAEARVKELEAAAGGPVWQRHGEDEWVLGAMVRGVVRQPYLAEVYFGEECDRFEGGWVWFTTVGPPGSAPRGVAENLDRAVRLAEEALRERGVML